MLLSDEVVGLSCRRNVDLDKTFEILNDRWLLDLNFKIEIVDGRSA